MKVFESSDSEGSDIETKEFTINKAFAHKYEYNKKREEKQKLEEKWGKDEVEDDDSQDSEDDVIEDENGQLITPEIDAQILKTIALLQKKDDSVYNENQSFFNEVDLEKAKKDWLEKAKKSSKPVLLKDYQRKRLLNESSSTANATDSDSMHMAGPTFVEEQEALKKQFKNAVEQEEEDGELFSVRPVNDNQAEAEKEKYSEFLLSQIPDEKSREKWLHAKKLDDAHAAAEGGEKKDEEDFLMQFVLNRGWVDASQDKIPSYNEITLHDSTDEEEDEKVDDFEAKYNFRFEEGGSEHVITHARNIPGIVRRKDNSRILKRQEEKEKKEQKKEQKQQELKRLKNLKRQELAEKLKKIQEMAGGDLVGLNEIDLEGDFDPEQHDERMDQIFADDYYSNMDTKSSGKPKKPKWDDDIDISDLVPAEEDSGLVSKGKKKGISAALSRVPQPQEQEDDYYLDHEGEDNDETNQPSIKSQIEKYLDEYYQLDYEDMIGEMPVRFKYRQVDAEDYSLKPEEIFTASDKDLNNIVSLKKLGPYRSGAVKQRDSQKWKLTKKKKLWEFRAKLKGKSVAPAPVVADDAFIQQGRINKKMRKEANITADRLASYSSIKKK